MNLVIVESPSKTKTIKQFLGKDYNVVATKGHIRDIDNCGVDNLGIDIKNGYKPIYSIIPKQYPTIKMLNEEISKADNIYLATDPDREGEAISWHLKETLKLSDKYVKRIEFNEITEQAIINAIKNPRDINENLFHSQETRKIFDRIIGFKLSQQVKKAIGADEAGEAPTAGRVQSATLKMIVDREKEIEAFVPETFYEIEADFKDFKAKLYESGKNKVKVFDSLEEAEKVLNDLDDIFVVSDVKETTKKERPAAPLSTSTLIQTALNKYYLSSKKTMKIAQELYEGIEVNGKHIAFITYMRTDSQRFSDQFKGQLYNYIKDTFGEEYNGYLHQKKVSDNENVQDAHEAIRPVSLKMTKEKSKEYLTKEQYQVYSLIYDQTVESMMKDADILVKTVTLTNNNHEFQTSFEKTTFDGFKKNRDKEEKEKEFKKELGDIINSNGKSKINKKETEGPKRFSEATLIKEMELSGIGRPSTYASTIDTLKSRKYVSIPGKKHIVPTTQGKLVSNFLDQHYSEIINVEYTKGMEETLDEIANGSKEEDVTVPEFYKSFMNLVNERKTDIAPLETGEVCPNCGSKMVYRSNKFGRFEACSNYPTCKYIKKPEVVEEKATIECPECHTGHLIQRIAKGGKYAGKKFYGCSNFPECKFTISSLKTLNKK